MEFRTQTHGCSASVDEALRAGAHNADIAVDGRGISSSVYVEREWREQLMRIPGIMNRSTWERKHHRALHRRQDGAIRLVHMYGQPPEIGRWRVVNFTGETVRRFRNRAQVQTLMSFTPCTEFMLDDVQHIVYLIPIAARTRRSPRERLTSGDWFGY